MKLSGKECLILQGIFPEGGNFLTIDITKDVLKKVKLSQEEGTLIELKVVGNQIYWNDNKEGLVSKDVTFTKAELEYMMTIINKMETQNQITIVNSDTLKKIRAASTAKEEEKK